MKNFLYVLKNISRSFEINVVLHLDIRFVTALCQKELEPTPLWPLLLTWFNFNPSMDK